MAASRPKRILIGALTYGGIIAITLLAVDGICILFDLFPPTENHGDAELGWRPAGATGKMSMGRCIEFSTSDTINYQRNEDGVRTGLSRSSLRSDTTTLRIAVTGDSQTELCAPNAKIHAGVLETDLISRGIPAVVLPYGAGRYSPLQSYLAFRTVLRAYHPTVLVINVYTGNDLYDILRVDDRPHFEPVDTGYRIADPVWLTLDKPHSRHRSRVLFAARSMADAVGIRRLYLRVSELRRLGARHGAGWGTVFAYMKDLWRARDRTVGYPDAFTSQMLNQQLFFKYFPNGKEESIRRMRALMTLARRENPGLLLVLSPLPSYQLTGEQPVDSALVRTVMRLPIRYQEGVEQELELYDRLRGLAEEQGWVFVDNLAVLRSYRGSGRLYNNFDYHLLPEASELIGQAQAKALLGILKPGAR